MFQNEFFLKHERQSDIEEQSTTTLPNYASFGVNDFNDQTNNFNKIILNSFTKRAFQEDNQKNGETFFSISNVQNKRMVNFKGIKKLCETSENYQRRMAANFFKRVRLELILLEWYPLGEMVRVVEQLMVTRKIDSFGCLLRNSVRKEAAQSRLRILGRELRKTHLMERVRELTAERLNQPILQTLCAFATTTFFTVLSKYKELIFEAFIRITFDKKTIMKNYKGKDVSVAVKSKSELKNVFLTSDPKISIGSNNFFHFSRILNDPSEFLKNKQKRSSSNFLKSEFIMETEGRVPLLSLPKEPERQSILKVFTRRFSNNQIHSKDLPALPMKQRLFKNEVWDGKANSTDHKNSLLSNFSKKDVDLMSVDNQSNLGFSQMNSNLLNNLAAQMENNIAHLYDDPMLKSVNTPEDRLEKRENNSKQNFREKKSERKSYEKDRKDQESLPMKNFGKGVRVEGGVQSQKSQAWVNIREGAEFKSDSELLSQNSHEGMVKPEVMSDLLNTLDQLKHNLAYASLGEPVKGSLASQNEGKGYTTMSVNMSSISHNTNFNQARQLIFVLHYQFNSHLKKHQKSFLEKLLHNDFQANKSKLFFSSLLKKMTMILVSKSATFQKKKMFHISDIVLTLNKNYRKLVKNAFFSLKKGAYLSLPRESYSMRFEEEKILEAIIDYSDFFSPRTSNNHQIEGVRLYQEEELSEELEDPGNIVEDEFYTNLEEEYNQNARTSIDVRQLERTN